MSNSLRLSLLALALVVAPSTIARAAPPPPPPSYVMDVTHLLTGAEDASTKDRLSNSIASDVRTYLNDKLVAAGKPNWLQYWALARRNPGRVLAFSPDWRNNGSLMIIDEYDTVDRSNLPPGSLADPRYVSRATLYEFGADQKIHVIRTLVGGGFWITPKP